MGISFEHFETIHKNDFYKKIRIESENILSFLEETQKQLPKLFDSNFQSLDEVENYLKKISLPNKFVCAKSISDIPGWTCKECDKYTDSIFCHECYKKSKHLHKGHHLYFLPNSGGMCGCGEPEALYIFCPEHSGPHMTQIEIDDYISKVFKKDLLDKLKNYFDIFFKKISYYLILLEKLDLFCPEIFEKKYKDEIEEIDEFKELTSEKNYILALKKLFKSVLQNFFDFIKTITNNNLGMLYLISNYFMSNHFNKDLIEEDYKTNHRCVKFGIKDIEIIESNNELHICQCPFFTLLLLNWRDNIKVDQDLLLSFTKCFPLKHGFGIIYFSFFEKILQNKNLNLISNRIQFILDYSTKILAEKTNIIEETYEVFYKYFYEQLKENTINNDIIERINLYAKIMNYDCSLYSMPITKNLMNNKVIILIKRIVDCICLIHNKIKFKSIYPHPIFQNKGCSEKLINLEMKLLNIIESINMFTDWKDINNIKEIFKYIIDKIINQKSEGIEQLYNNEFSFHIGLYRCLGILINYFCFYYSFNNKSSIINSIEFFSKNFFESKNQLENLIDIILNDYFKFFGFISGIKNGFFNYYDYMNIYPTIYFLDQQLLKIDITLIKYLLSLTENNFNLYEYLQKTNIENSFTFFEKIFLPYNKDIINNIKNIDINKENYLSSDELINLLNNTNDIFPSAINYGNNLQLIQTLHENLNITINSNTIENYINGDLEAYLGLKNLKIDIDEINNIMHTKLILDILIMIIKDDSTPYYNLMKYYKNTSSTQTKNELFEKIKQNKYCMKDLNNIIKEKIICQFVAKGNLNNLEQIMENIDDYLFNIFEEKDINDILEKLTLNKKIGNNQLFYLRDSSFNFFDVSFYYSYKDISNSQKYIYDFKKDLVKSYNTYFFQPSELIFDFYEKVFQKILLKENNLEFIHKIIEHLLLTEKDNEKINSIKYIILPELLKFLSIFGCINTESFISFKIKNEDLINKIIQILSDFIKDKGKSIQINIIDNINEVINQLKTFKFINNEVKSDFSKLKKYDYNLDYIEKLNTINTSKIGIELNDEGKNNAKLKSIKNKLKDKMKDKNKNFLENILDDKKIFNEIHINTVIDENINELDEEMCFYCRNKIKLNSFDEPYGKGGYYFQDYFSSNALRATIKSELKKINKEIHYENDLSQKNNSNNLSIKIISCGHYFHLSCFKLNNNGSSSCPLCLKNLNILIPPLNNFHDKYDFFKPYEIQSLIEQKEVEEFSHNIFGEIINDFLSYYLNYTHDDDLLKKIIIIFKSSFNYLENIFYYKATNFHKLQQIQIHKNFILSVRYIVKADILSSNDIFNNIIENLSHLVKGPTDVENILNNYESMYYNDILEQIILYLSILFDYNIIKELVLYIIYIFLPYITFGFYLKDLIANIDIFPYLDEKILDKLNINILIEYIQKNNERLMECFKLFLKKLSLVKFITDYNNPNEKEDNILNNFNDLNIKDYLSLLGIDVFNSEKNVDDIKLTNIFEILSKSLNTSKIFEGKIGKELDYIKIFDLLIKNVKTLSIEKEKHLIKKELMVQFSPVIFQFIKLDENYFDFVEKYLEKKCIICSKVSRFFYVCLICGNKVCHTTECNDCFAHKRNCGGKYCIFIDFEDGQFFVASNQKKFYTSLYNNKQGIGPNSKRINNEYILNKEKEEQYFRNFICYDFHFK